MMRALEARVLSCAKRSRRAAASERSRRMRSRAIGFDDRLAHATWPSPPMTTRQLFPHHRGWWSRAIPAHGLAYRQPSVKGPERAAADAFMAQASLQGRGPGRAGGAFRRLRQFKASIERAISRSDWSRLAASRQWRRCGTICTAAARARPFATSANSIVALGEPPSDAGSPPARTRR